MEQHTAIPARPKLLLLFLFWPNGMKPMIKLSPTQAELRFLFNDCLACHHVDAAVSIADRQEGDDQRGVNDRMLAI